MIEREIDDVGRVVIPMEYRKNLGIEFNSKVLISSSRKTQKAEATKKHFRRGGYHPPENNGDGQGGREADSLPYE